jgi:hypothetical protein
MDVVGVQVLAERGGVGIDLGFLSLLVISRSPRKPLVKA